MPDQKITQLPASAGLALADQIEICDNPGVSPASERSTIQAIHDTINLLTASGALTVSDTIPLTVGGVARKATTQKVHDSTNVLTASAALALANKIAVYNGGSAKQCTPDVLMAATDALVASGALGLSDVFAVFNGGAATKGTIQKLLNAINVLSAWTSAAVGDKVPIYKTSAKAADYADIEDALWNQSTASNGWVKRGLWVRTGATVDSLGDTFPSYAGTVSASAVDATQPQGANNASSAVINSFATNGSATAGARWTLVNNLRHTFYFKLVNNTDVRFYLGLFSAGVHRNAADSGNVQWADGNFGVAVSGIGIRFSTSAGDTNFQLVDSNAGTVAVTNTGVAPDTTNMQQVSFRLRNNGTQIDVYFGGTKVIDGYTFTCPTSASIRVSAGLTNIAAVAKNWRYFGYYVAQKFY